MQRQAALGASGQSDQRPSERGARHAAQQGWGVRKDGTRFWVHATVTAVRDSQGRLCGYAKVTQDITRLHEAIDALRRGDQHTRLLPVVMGEVGDG